MKVRRGIFYLLLAIIGFLYPEISRPENIISKNVCGSHVIGNFQITTSSPDYFELSKIGNFVYINYINLDSNNLDSKVKIIDVSSPSKPRLVGSVELRPPSSLAIEGSFGYFLSEKEIKVLNISNPANPELIGSLDLGCQSWKIKVSDNYAYILDERGFEIVDLSAKKVISTLDTYEIDGEGELYDIAVKGKFAFVASYKGLTIIDLSNVFNPKIVSRIGTHDTPSIVSVVDNYAYVAAWDGIDVIDVTDPYNPKFVGVIQTAPDIEGLYVNGTHIYVGDEEGIKVMRRVNAYEFYEVEKIDIGNVFDLYVDENSMLIFAITAGGSLKIIDISNMPDFIISRLGIFTFAINKVVEKGNYIYIGGQKGIGVIDVSNPMNPRLVGRVDVEDSIFDVFVAGNYIYATGVNTGFLVIDIAKAEEPKVVSKIHFPGKTLGLFVSGNYAFVANEKGLEIIDVTNPRNPKLVTEVKFPRSVRVYVNGNFAYLIGESGLSRIDVSNPTTPKVLYTLPIEGYSVAVYNGYAYVITKGRKLKVLDLSWKPPLVVKEIPLDVNSGNIVVMDNYLYIPCEVGLKIFDITSPKNPELVCSLEKDMILGRDVYVGENYIYFTEGLVGYPREYYLYIDIIDKQKVEKCCLRRMNTLIIRSGWNLITIPVERYVNVNELGNFTILWKYSKSENKWAVWSPDEKVMSVIEKYVDAGTYELAEKVNPGEGFWILSDSSYSLEFEGDRYTYKDLHLTKGWNLVGVGKTFSVEKLSSVSGLQLIWKYKEGKWYAWSPNKNIMGIINSYAKSGIIGVIKDINAGEGFWVKVEK